MMPRHQRTTQVQNARRRLVWSEDRAGSPGPRSPEGVVVPDTPRTDEEFARLPVLDLEEILTRYAPPER